MDIKQQLQYYADQNYSRSQIASLFGKSTRWVNKKLREFGIHTHAKTGPERTKPKGLDACLVCGKQVKKNASKYCSSACCAQDKWNKTVIFIEQKEAISDPRQGRRYLIEKYGHRCVICGATEWTGKAIPLVLDHIDGHSENCSLENVRMICCNCDALTPTYKNKNRGNGRHARKMRYREGKSY